MPSLQWRPLWLGLGWLMVFGVVYLSLMPDPPQPVAFPFFDKVEHAAGFAWLALWFLQVAGRRLAVAAGLLLLGAAIEVAQSFTPTRLFELADLGADAAGIAVGALLARTAAGRMLAATERRFASRAVES
jgi:VanZ family protein